MVVDRSTKHQHQINKKAYSANKREQIIFVLHIIRDNSHNLSAEEKTLKKLGYLNMILQKKKQRQTPN